jgi:hypothetical protein
MLASFVIGFHTRRIDNLLQTVRFLELWHADVVKESELVLVCQDRCGRIDTTFRTYHHFNLEVANMQLPKLSNFGISQSTSDNIVLLESDRILPAGYFRTVLSEMQAGQQITTLNMHRLTKMASDQAIIDKTYAYRNEQRSTSNGLGMRNAWSGNTAFKKSDFLAAGGMDESYVGYGWADHDMTAAMHHIGVKSIYRDELELHLYHEPMTYGSGDQKRLFIQNGLRYCKKWNHPVPDMLREEISKYTRFVI